MPLRIYTHFMEVSEFTRSQVLTQATTAMLAQANVIPQNALSLLQ